MSFTTTPGGMLVGVGSTWACGQTGTSGFRGSVRRVARCSSSAQPIRAVLSDRPSTGSAYESDDRKKGVFHKGGNLNKLPKKDGKVVLNDKYLDSAQYIWNVNWEVS